MQAARHGSSPSTYPPVRTVYYRKSLMFDRIAQSCFSRRTSYRVLSHPHFERDWRSAVNAKTKHGLRPGRPFAVCVFPDDEAYEGVPRFRAKIRNVQQNTSLGLHEANGNITLSVNGFFSYTLNCTGTINIDSQSQVARGTIALIAHRNENPATTTTIYTVSSEPGFVSLLRFQNEYTRTNKHSTDSGWNIIILNIFPVFLFFAFKNQ